ncbi:PEP-CTERM sorting domain-containing protein [Cyanobacteria bacterium FACHB-472]|nr:PEP-CTERM sorting domain-containing protein [Cyanobacteria bacterium FACHB-472]
MHNFPLSLFLGLTATAVVLTPLTVQAATFDYSQVKNWTTRPIDSNNILNFFGDLSRNEGYANISNLDPNAPDAGHVSIALNALPGSSGYYITGREFSPDPQGATRSASLENLTGFSNFFHYLNSNNILLSSIGVSFGQKPELDFTKSLNLGEDKLGQDWFASPDSPIEERIYRANPDDFEIFLTYGTTKLLQFGYSDFYFAVDNGSTPDFTDNFNVFLSDPVPAFKVAGLDPLTSGLADALLQDVTAAGGSVQFVSEDPDLEVEPSFIEGFDSIYLSFPIELRAVKSKSVPESSSVLGVLMFGILGTATRMAKQKKSSF